MSHKSCWVLAGLVEKVRQWRLCHFWSLYSGCRPPFPAFSVTPTWKRNNRVVVGAACVGVWCVCVCACAALAAGRRPQTGNTQQQEKEAATPSFLRQKCAWLIPLQGAMLESLRLNARRPPAVLGGGGPTSERLGDEEELLGRAPAVLKSQGPENNWPRGRPGQKALFPIPLHQHNLCLSCMPLVV